MRWASSAAVFGPTPSRSASPRGFVVDVPTQAFEVERETSAPPGLVPSGRAGPEDRPYRGRHPRPQQHGAGALRIGDEPAVAGVTRHQGRSEVGRTQGRDVAQQHGGRLLGRQATQRGMDGLVETATRIVERADAHGSDRREHLGVRGHDDDVVRTDGLRCGGDGVDGQSAGQNQPVDTVRGPQPALGIRAALDGDDDVPRARWGRGPQAGRTVVDPVAHRRRVLQPRGRLLDTGEDGQRG